MRQEANQFETNWREMGESSKQSRIFFLFVLAWVGIQIWLIDARWVNNDEGAHLIDAWLTTLGLIPDVDFIGRQPLYTLLYTPVVWLGGGYKAARLIPVAATVLGALVLRAIGRKSCGSTGDLAALFYLYSPTVLINAAQVKTEPPVILFVCLSVWSYSRFVEQRKEAWLIAAGISAGLGFYIRESALAVLLALLFSSVFIAHCKKGAAILLTSWAAVVALAMMIYSRWFPWKQMFLSDRLFPPAAVLRAGGELLGLLGHSKGGLRASSQPWVQTVREFADPALMNWPLLGLALAAFYIYRASWMRRQDIGVPIFWLGCTALLYAYHVGRHGFFQAYFLEFLPPLCLLAAVGFRELYGAAAMSRLLVAIPGLLIIGACSGQLLGSFNHTLALAAVIGASLLGAAVFRYRGRSPAVGCLLASTLAAAIFAGTKIGLSYHSPFAPSTVRAIAALVSERTETEDEVLSGAVIWEFQARRRPFANWSHPLSLDSGSKKPELWRTLFADRPPAVIVWDKTASKLFLQFPEVQQALEDDYRVGGEIDGISIFLRKADHEL